MMEINLKKLTKQELLIFGGIARIILLGYGQFHDQTFEVKYTDIDYKVFTDAAAHVVNGSSPYNRNTYRYTPILALILTPNIIIHHHFGKLLFCIFDLIDGILMLEILKLRFTFDKITYKSIENENIILVLSCWILNPFTITISTRGNAEAMQAALVLGFLYFILKGNVAVGGILYGLAVHFKIYPILYALPGLLYIGQKNQLVQRGKQLSASTANDVFFTLLNTDTVLFTISSAASFMIINGLLFYWYGMEFLEHTYLYHITRQDMKHNFSPYFYILHLIGSSSLSKVIGILAFLPQVISVLYLGIKYHKNLALACFLQTFAFVTFNKVCTSQYFIWYISLLPLALPSMRIDKKNGLVMLTLWLLSQGVWLFFAYLFEFRGYNTLFLVWIASTNFLGVNVYILWKLVSSCDQETVKFSIGNKKE